jgi:hypothetical protein
MLKGGKVVMSSLGVFSEPTLYRFLPRYESQLTHLRAHPSSPFVISCQYGKYTSRALNTEELRHRLFGADTHVDLYVQEDARFAVAVLRGAPDLAAIPVALMGTAAAHAHTIAMRTLNANVGKKVHRQFEALNIDPMLGATIALAQTAKKNSPEAHHLAPSIAFLQRAEHGEVVHIDLSEEDRERLLSEAAALWKAEGGSDLDADEEVEDGVPDSQPRGRGHAANRTKPPTVPPPSASIPPNDPFGFLGRPR